MLQTSKKNKAVSIMDHTEAPVPPAACYWHACVCICFEIVKVVALWQTKQLELEGLES